MPHEKKHALTPNQRAAVELFKETVGADKKTISLDQVVSLLSEISNERELTVDTKKWVQNKLQEQNVSPSHINKKTFTLLLHLYERHLMSMTIFNWLDTNKDGLLSVPELSGIVGMVVLLTHFDPPDFPVWLRERNIGPQAMLDLSVFCHFMTALMDEFCGEMFEDMTRDYSAITSYAIRDHFSFYGRGSASDTATSSTGMGRLYNQAQVDMMVETLAETAQSNADRELTAEQFRTIYEEFAQKVTREGYFRPRDFE